MTTTSSFSISKIEYDMVMHVIEIGVLQELKLFQCNIYKVSFNLRKVNQETYTPRLISIGHIHFGKDKLKPMQETEQRYFYFFYERLPNEQVMKDYKHNLESKEQDIRQCYVEIFAGHITKEKIVEIMVLDVVFIMELLLRNVWKLNRSKHEQEHVPTNSFRMEHTNAYIMSQSWLDIEIARDLILLENQIPFFVLNELYETIVPHVNKKEEHTCFVDLALEYFTFYDLQRSSSSETKIVLSGKKNSEENKDSSVPKHFLDLISFFYLPTSELGECGCPDSLPRTATKLKEAGVNFEKVLKTRLLDITFNKTRILSSFLCLSCIRGMKYFTARFRIPQLKVDHRTKYVLRNLIAFEQCHYPEEQYICNYVSLLDSLIHTEADVELLVNKKVILHRLGSDEEVATLINSLCKHVTTNRTCYYEMINKLNKHYNSRWNRSMAALWLIYLKDTSRTSATLVAIIVVGIGIINFLRAMKIIG